MIRSLRSVCIWAAMAAMLISWVPLLGLIRLFDRDPRRERTARWFRRLGRNMGRAYPCRIRIHGLENLKPGKAYIVVSNHQSMADIPVVANLRLEAKWLVKSELFHMPFTGWLLRMSEDIPVYRSDRVKSAKALLESARRLRQGLSIVCFPEGTRSRDGELLPFNEGPFQLAIREKVPVLPVVVEGTRHTLERNSWIFGPSADVHLTVLPEVSPEGLSPKQSGELRDAVRSTIAADLARQRAAAAR